MRSQVRTFVVVAVALALLALFLYNVDLCGVLAAIAAARPEWLALSLATMLVNLSIRALRWQYLLEPLARRLDWSRSSGSIRSQSAIAGLDRALHDRD